MNKRTELPQVDVVRLGMTPESWLGVGKRWALFELALCISIVPAWLGLTVMPSLTGWQSFFNLAWTWQIIAFAPGGYARVEIDGAIWFANTAWVLSLIAWLAAGLACAYGLRRISLARFALLALPLVLAVGTLLHLAVRLFGFVPYAGV